VLDAQVRSKRAIGIDDDDDDDDDDRRRRAY